ncbi:MAG TPA: LysR family transcriptional regulator [Aestuariivirga sp.]|jgi:LysR family glycine cleavage system transcriptional activator|nr:LysR family transcriptional regulator [Aestuariivirga sp.]
MDWSGLPSLNSLKGFSALAELGSYSRAGTALNVTHAAVSQQIKALEAHLGVTLVARIGRKITLTEEGRTLARDLAAGFATIRKGIDAVTGADAIRPVQITTSPAFAVMWLMSRIVDFQQQHPGITLLLNPTSEIVELKPGGIDLAIRYREGRAPDTGVDPVLIADMVVVGTPGLIGGRELTDPAMLADMPWLQELGTHEVARWMERHGVAPTRPPIITHMPGNLIMEAVRRGDGITYTARPFVEKELRSGQLVELFSDEAFGTYYIQPRPGILSPQVKLFITWLKQQATNQASVHS